MSKLRHVGIVTKDVNKSISFYSNFGFVVQRDMWESGNCIDTLLALSGVCVRTIKMVLPAGDMIELLFWKSHPECTESRRITQIGCSHIALTVSGLEELYNKLYDSGIVFNSPPQDSFDGKVKLAFCKDPNGVFVELVEEL